MILISLSLTCAVVVNSLLWLIVVVIEEDLVEKVVLEKGDVVVVEVLVC